MALVKFGGGIVQMAGSIAGDTFARNRYGNYVRARTKPINPNTALQQKVRSSLTWLTNRWSQTLTAPQRAAWNLYGANVVMNNRLGESMNLSGFNHYIRSNASRKAFNLAIIDAGPVIFEIPDADPAYAITASEATQQIQHTFDDTLAWDNEAGGFLFLFAGQPQNAQRNFFGGPWRAIGHLPGDGAPGTPAPFASAYPWGIAEDQHIWCYARIMRADGRLSAPFRDDVLVGA